MPGKGEENAPVNLKRLKRRIIPRPISTKTIPLALLSGSLLSWHRLFQEILSCLKRQLIMTYLDPKRLAKIEASLRQVIEEPDFSR